MKVKPGDRGPWNSSTIYVQENGRAFYGDDASPAYYRYLHQEFFPTYNPGSHDAGDVLYGMSSLAIGAHVTHDGRLIPGYGIPPAGGPFESPGSLAYRVTQTTRTTHRILWNTFTWSIVLWVVSLLFGAATGSASFFFVMCFVCPIMLVAAIVLTPILFVATPATIVINAKRRNEKALHDMAQPPSLPPYVVQEIVDHVTCGGCGTTTYQYNAGWNTAYCPTCDRSWKVALAPNFMP